MMTFTSRTLRKIDAVVTPRLPAKVAARLDWRVANLQSFGGPLNGQVERRRIVRDLAAAIPFRLVVETGTFRGTSTDFFYNVFGARIETVEMFDRFYEFAQRRFRANNAINVARGDSRVFLTELARRGDLAEPTFFYLDAHWYDDLPLRDELITIRDNWPKAVVLIDDFQVFDDDGYTFDAYGEGRDLVLGYLPPLPGWGRYFPAVSSQLETGARRGSIVLAAPEMDQAVSGLESLRRVSDESST